MTSGGTLDPDAFVREQVARFGQLRERAEQVKAELAQNTATARSEGVVTVTVGAGGVMQSISFGPKAEGLGAAKLSATTMRVYGQACRAAAARSQQILGELVGPDSPTLQLMRDAVPPDPDEEEPR
ncbi:MAG: YbaB/EbfC family nucleoid-associated protein [Jatrophihabitantaceae bacterium]